MQHSLPHSSADLLITLWNLNQISSVYSIPCIKLHITGTICRDVKCKAFSSPEQNTSWSWIIAFICRTPVSWPEEVSTPGQGHRIQLHNKNVLTNMIFASNYSVYAFQWTRNSGSCFHCGPCYRSLLSSSTILTREAVFSIWSVLCPVLRNRTANTHP